MQNCRIRIATVEDAEKLLEIYAPYVEKTAVSFESTPPTMQDFKRRIGRILEQYPYLVAEQAGKPVGYAYASPFHTRAAYRWGVETTVYVRGDRKRMGIGKALYQALEDILSLQNILNLNACIAYPETEDEHLTKSSVQFHEHLGYRLVGRFHQCGYKFGRWYDIVWMEKLIGDHMANPPAVRPFGEIKILIAQKLEIL